MGSMRLSPSPRATLLDPAPSAPDELTPARGVANPFDGSAAWISSLISPPEFEHRGGIAASRAKARRARMLLDALCGFESSLNENKQQYTLSPLAAKFLVRESPDYMGAFLETDEQWEGWSRLKEAVRTGSPIHSIFDPSEAERFFSVLTRTLHVQNRLPSQRLAKTLGVASQHKGLNVLDVGCGSGVWGIAIAEADPDSRVVAQDLPKVLEQTRKYLERHGVAKRYDFLPGDLHRVSFPAGKFDLALLGHIAHGEGEPSVRQIFKRLHSALKPGGRLAIIDMIPNEERTGPPFPLIFALNMLVHTDEGGTYTLNEYKTWLAEAGFSSVEMVEFGDRNGVAAVIARK